MLRVRMLVTKRGGSRSRLHEFTWLALFLAIFLSGISLRVVGAQTLPVPVSRWPFDEATGTIAHDTVGTNPGTLVNSAAFTSGLLGNAVYLDGISGRVEVPNSANLTITGAVTVEAVVKLAAIVPPGAVGLSSPIVAKWGDSGTGGYGLFLLPNSAIPSFAISTTGFDNKSAAATSPLSLNQWHHLAGTYDGVVVKLYVDGVLVAQTSVGFGIFPASVPVVMGNWNPTFTTTGGGNAPIKGKLDQVSIYNQALDAATIQLLANKYAVLHATP